MIELSTNLFRQAMRARLRASALYLDDPRVTLIDVGLRIHEREEQITDELTVRVHVRHKLRGPAFEDFAIRNPERVVDESRVDFPVDVIEGNYRLQTRPIPRRSGLFNPLRGGISISNEWFFNYGTLGGWVRDLETGQDMLMSNWHVLAGTSLARRGLRIYQPGTGDGGWRLNTIARLERHGMDQGIDAAVASLTGARQVVNDSLGIGPVTGPGAPVLGMRVVKSGRASGVTQGIITGVEGLQTLQYRGFSRVVRHVVHIAQAPEGGQISAPGDSGSWWLDAATRQAVGLHFAGDDDPEYGLAIAMPETLAALNVEIVPAEAPFARPEAARVVRQPEPAFG